MVNAMMGMAVVLSVQLEKMLASQM